jgi:phage FluMu protein Com
MGEKSGRGKLRVRCTECQKKHRRMIARKSARKCYTPSKRDYTCNVCKDVFTQEGRGKLRKKCPTCLEVKSNSSTYTPEVDKEAETMLKDMGL